MNRTDTKMTDLASAQAAASEQGRHFEQTSVTTLQIEGWKVIATHVIIAGVEVDIVADDPDGRRWWIECKGSWRGRTPGSRRGDTVKKAVGVAWYLHQQPNRCPYMLITSHLPGIGGVPGLMLQAAIDAGLFDRVLTIGLHE